MVSLLGYLGYCIYATIQHKKQVAQTIKTLPDFAYTTINGKVFTNQNLKKDTATIFFYYNSECDFCNHEAEQVKEKIALFNNIQLVFVSFEESEKIKAFAQLYKLENYDNITFVRDTKLSFATTFDVKGLPAVIIYNKNNTLVQKLKGQTKPEKIVALLNE
jgi:peroxiredoxin